MKETTSKNIQYGKYNIVLTNFAEKVHVDWYGLDLRVTNGGKGFWEAWSLFGLTYGRNPASALMLMQKMIDKANK